jgi:hypothetical protein
MFPKPDLLLGRMSLLFGTVASTGTPNDNLFHFQSTTSSSAEVGKLFFEILLVFSVLS